MLVPTALIALVFAAWRLGAGPVLSFWVAYILTRPLGANIGDFLGLAKAEGGVGLGTAVTSYVFLAIIVAIVSYLSVTKVDVTKSAERDPDDDPKVALVGA